MPGNEATSPEARFASRASGVVWSRCLSLPYPRSDHFDGREFHNLDGAPAGRPFADVLRWKLLGGRPADWPQQPGAEAVTPALPTHLSPDEAAATFIGHSTFLLQFADGLNVLTDPVWSERVSPVKFAGPRRARPPAIAFDDLPPVQLVLVSHGHYDHLDLATLRRLDERFNPLFLTGLGNHAFLRGHGLRQVEELDWWQSHRFRGLEVTFTPAQHWSKRSAGKRNDTLWGGFWLRSGKLSVYFTGDTGLGPFFTLIRERLGSPDLAFLPIGAYEPRWFMREQHMNPADAVQAHRTLAARRSVAMHFGTFQLTDEAIDQPVLDLAAARQLAQVDPAEFIVPRFGETIRAGV